MAVPQRYGSIYSPQPLLTGPGLEPGSSFGSSGFGQSYILPTSLQPAPLPQPQLAQPSSVRLAPAPGPGIIGSVSVPSSLQFQAHGRQAVAPLAAIAAPQALAPASMLSTLSSSYSLGPYGEQASSLSLPLQATVAGERVTMPGQPSRLTVGMISPEDVAIQRQEYSRNLEEQRMQGEQLLTQQAEQQRELLRIQAEQQKVLAMGRWDQHLRAQELQAEREYQQQLASLREAAAQQRSALEEQAAALIMEYNARRTQQEINRRNYELQTRQWEAQQSQRQQQLMGMDLSSSTKAHLTMQFQQAMQQVGAMRRMEGHLPELPLGSWVPDNARTASSAGEAPTSPYPLAPPLTQ